MDILVFDKEYDSFSNDYLAILQNNLKDYNIVLLKNFEEAISLFKKSHFYIILIDFTTKDGKEFLQEVNRLNSIQRVITMGYTLSCSSEMGCTYCIDNFNKRRLIKPINSIDLYKTISTFDEILCAYANRFAEPKTLINEILQKYSSFTYDEKTLIISSANDDIQEIKQLLNLMIELKNYDIDYEIISERSIQII